MTLEEYMAQMSPEDAQRLPEVLAQLGAAPERQQLLQEAQARAEALRGTPIPQGRTVRNGIFVASSPLEAIGSGVSRLAGGIQSGLLARQQRQAIDDKAAARAQQLRAYSNAARAGGGGAPQQPNPSLGMGMNYGARGQMLGGAQLQIPDGQGGTIPWPANLPLPGQQSRGELGDYTQPDLSAFLG